MAQPNTPQDASNDPAPNDGKNTPPTQTNNANGEPAPTNINVPPSKEDVLPKKEVEALLVKVRQEEKNKLYPEIEKLKTKSTELETIKKTLEEQIQEKQKEVEELRAGKLGELDSVNKELSELRDTNQKLSTAIETVASEAAERIQKSEMESYRERRLREAGLIKLHDMVKGESKEAIEASLKSAQETEKSLLEMAKEEAMAQLAKDLPRPIAPDGSQGRELSTMTPQKRSNVVKLDDAEYQKQRKELLDEAKRKAGM